MSREGFIPSLPQLADSLALCFLTSFRLGAAHRTQRSFLGPCHVVLSTVQIVSSRPAGDLFPRRAQFTISGLIVLGQAHPGTSLFLTQSQLMNYLITGMLSHDIHRPPAPNTEEEGILRACMLGVGNSRPTENSASLNHIVIL